jgi:hypothetical protein
MVGLRSWLVPSLVLFGFFGVILQAGAQSRPEGKYRCVTLEVDHHAAPCQSPPLILGNDGSYQIWGERGTYEVVDGEWLRLSHSKRRGMGHFENVHEIVFEYLSGGKVCRVRFQQMFAAPRGLSLG